MTPLRRVYRWALRLLPRDLREKHGAAMEALFHRQVVRARRRGLPAACLAAGRGLADLALRAAYERLRNRTFPSPEHGMDAFLNDVRFAFRSLVRSPRFTVLAVTTLALGIGANSALFSVVNGVVLRPLPFPEADRVVHLAWERGGRLRAAVPAWKYAYWRDHARSFDAATTWREFRPLTGEAPEALRGLRVTRDFLDVLGWSPVLGRDFAPGEDRPGSPAAVALVSHGLWTSRFARDPGVVGRTLDLDGTPHAVVGVLPEAFAFPQAEGVQVVVPLGLDPVPSDEGENYPVLVRLAGGVERDAADAEVRSVTASFRSDHPELAVEGDGDMTLAAWRDLYLGNLRTVLHVLAGATGFVLLIACVNVASLMLARGSARGPEVAVRTALGAGRSRLVRQVVAEGVLLALAAGGAGLVLGQVGVTGLLGLYPGSLPRGGSVGLDLTVVAATTAVALACGVTFGLAAALPVGRGRFTTALREGGRSGSPRQRGRKALLAAEAALSVVLLVGAGLLVATFLRLARVDPGFRAEGLLTVRLAPDPGTDERAAREALERGLLDRLSADPGVAVAAAASNLPLERGINIPVTLGGRPDEFEGAVEWRAVSPGYLEALDVALVSGRRLTARDDEGAPPVALVNEAFVRRWFPGEEPVGRRIEIGRYRGQWVHPAFEGGGAEIVGVFADARERSLRTEAARTVLVPRAQAPGPLLGMPVLLVRGRGGLPDPAVVRRAVEAVAPSLPAPTVRPMSEVVGASLARDRFAAVLMAAFAGVALALTAFGVFGVVSYGVHSRTREIGVRIALGARAPSVVALVVAQGMLPVLAGLGAGMAGAAFLARAMGRALPGVAPADPGTWGAVAALMAAVALGASWLPARRAARLDPARSLRPE